MSPKQKTSALEAGNRAVFNLQATVRDQLRAKYPRRAERAAQTSKTAAIELFCIECVGGESSRAAKKCECSGCFLWPHAFGRSKRSTGDSDDR